MERFLAGLVVTGVSILSFSLSSSDAGAEDRPVPAHEYKKERGPLAVGSVTYEWRDALRDRDVPVKIYYPKSGAGPFPVIVFSHGLGGSREGYAYLGRHWTSHGYVVVHVQHKGSDVDVWKAAGGSKAALRAAAQDPQNALNRPKDISFAIDQLEKLQRETPPLQGRLDLARISAAGHSFGAYTTLAVAGQVFISAQGHERSFGDPRVKAMVVMSGPGPKRKDLLDKVYGSIHIPGLHMTGTRDESPIGLTAVADRRVPFDQIRGADQYLVIFKDGDHMVFAGLTRFRKSDEDRLFHELTQMSTTAFWDAYLKGDAKAREWLAGFQAVLGPNGSFERKSASDRK